VWTSFCRKRFVFTPRDVQVAGMVGVEALENLTCSTLEHGRRRYSSLLQLRLGLLTGANRHMPYDSCPEPRGYPGRP
jgi:hypothetical protein